MVNQAADQVLASDQPQNSEGTRAHRAAVAACPRRRGDRIATFFPQRGMSAFGTKRTWRSRSTMSAFGGKADIPFDPKTDNASRYVGVFPTAQTRLQSHKVPVRERN